MECDLCHDIDSIALGSFLRMFLGPINVRASRKDVQLKVKEEYNSYRVYIYRFLNILVNST